MKSQPAQWTVLVDLTKTLKDAFITTKGVHYFIKTFLERADSH